MNSLKSVVRIVRRRWWLWMPVSGIGAFFLIWIIALASHWFASIFQESFSDASPELLFFGLGLYGNILIAIATIGAPLAIWRGLALQKQSEAALKHSEAALKHSDAALKQSDAALKQSEIALRQSEITQGGLLADRYRTGVEMLGSKVLSVRHGGIYVLERVAESDPFTYHIPAMSVLSVFIRDSHGKDEQDGGQDNAIFDNEQKELPPDVRTVLEVIGRRSSKQHQIESEKKYMVNLRGTCLRRWKPDAPTLGPYPDFSNVDFSDADLSQVDLSLMKCANSRFIRTNLSGAWLIHTDLSDASFLMADLSGTRLARANLARANFDWAKLSKTNLGKAEGLTQEQVSSAKIDAQHPPVLTDAVDANTKKPLIVPLQ